MERRAPAGWRELGRIRPSWRLSADRHSPVGGPVRPGLPAAGVGDGDAAPGSWSGHALGRAEPVAGGFQPAADGGLYRGLFADPIPHRGYDLDGAGRRRLGPDLLALAEEQERKLADQRQRRDDTGGAGDRQRS